MILALQFLLNIVKLFIFSPKVYEKKGQEKRVY